jgi:hypothetical protein
MKVPGEFPPGCKFFERESGSLAVVIPGKGAFSLIGGVLEPVKLWPPLSEPRVLSEASWREAAAREAAA